MFSPASGSYLVLVGNTQGRETAGRQVQTLAVKGPFINGLRNTGRTRPYYPMKV